VRATVIHRSDLTEPVKEHIRRLYAASVRHFDDHLAPLLEAMRARHGDDFILVFTADHGESLGENDYWFAHGDRLDDALVRVPLLIRTPGAAAARRDDVAALVDLFPTLLARAVAVSPEPDAAGRDLLADGAERIDSAPYLATLGSGGPIRFGIVSDGYKLILTQGAHGVRSELFRVGDDERDLAGIEPDREAGMHEILRERRARLRTAPAEEQQRLSDEDRANLQALGYLDEVDRSEPD
jgi:arylsulfatase A-like enzyme